MKLFIAVLFFVGHRCWNIDENALIVSLCFLISCSIGMIEAVNNL